LEHPNIVRLYEVGEQGGNAFVAMELIRGESLREQLVKRGPYDPPDALALVAKLARAVHHAHGKGLIHRDLKPENILLEEAGEPRIIDFGLARAPGETDHKISVEGDTRGTPHYLAPEQARGEVDRLDARTDVWGLGVVL